MHTIMAVLYSTFLFLTNVLLVNSYSTSEFVTQTVYGFLDFTTTIENTVMIFSPQSAPVLEIKHEIRLPTTVIETKPTVNTSNDISPTKLAESINLRRNETQFKLKSNNILMTLENKVNIKTNTSVIILDNDLPQPEYDLLSRQPAEYIEETYKVHNFRQSNYGNVLESSIYESRPSEVVHNTNFVKLKKNKHRSSNSQVRVLKNTEYSTQITTPENQSQKNVLNRSFTRKNNLLISTKPSHLLNATLTDSNRKVKKSRNKSKRRKNYQNSKSSSNQMPNHTTETSTRRSFKTKVRPSNTEPTLESSLKLIRTPGRWQYKSPPKPRVNIRNVTTITFNNTTETDKDSNLILNTIPSFSEDFDHALNKDGMNYSHSDVKDVDLWETLNIEISTSSDYPDTYYEIATIKTPYIFQAGVVKKTRFVTITSTIEKVLTLSNSELTKSLTPENILSTPVDNILVESSLKTLDEIHLSNGETPSLETITDVLSTKIIKLKTEVLPFVYDSENITKLITIVQTYDISTFITATKTISPLSQSKYNPSQNFKDFSGTLDEAGSEYNLEIDISNEENTDSKPYSNLERNKNILMPNNGNSSNQNFHSYDFRLKQPSIPNYNYPNLYTSNSVNSLRKPETIWETHIIPLVNGVTTIYQTISKSVGIKEFTDILEDPVKFSQPMSINPYVVPNQLNFQTITSSIAQKTVITQTNSKILRLTFGAKTAYTTLFSTTVIPTEYTQVITTAVPFAPTAAFPGYFPPPYPFAFLG